MQRREPCQGSCHPGEGEEGDIAFQSFLRGQTFKGSWLFLFTHARAQKEGAVTAVKIARHYGARVMLFRGEEIPY